MNQRVIALKEHFTLARASELYLSLDNDVYFGWLVGCILQHINPL